MKLVRNVGSDRVVDLVATAVTDGRQLDAVTADMSIFACAELLPALHRAARCRLVLPADASTLPLLGSSADRAARNRLQAQWLASRVREWLSEHVSLRLAREGVPQGAVVVRDASSQPLQALFGSLAFTTEGLGLTPGNPLSLIQASESAEEALMLSQWFDPQWASLADDASAKDAILDALDAIARHRDPHLAYALVLQRLFGSRGDELDEERIVKSATGIRNTVVWKKLYKFQRDGVVGAIDKLEPLRRLHHRRQRRPREDLRGAGHHQVLRAAQRPRAGAVPEAAARQLDALQGQRPPQHPRAGPLQLRRAQPHRPLPRRRHCRATSTSRTSTGATTTSSSSTSRTTSATRRRRARAARRATTA